MFKSHLFILIQILNIFIITKPNLTNSKVIFLKTFIQLLINYFLKQRNYRLEIDNITCQHNASYLFGAHDCWLKRDKEDNIIKISLYINLLKQINEFHVHYTLHLSRNNMPRLKLFDLNLNVCSLLKNLHKEKLFRIVLEKIKRVLNADCKCPFKAVSFSIMISKFKKIYICLLIESLLITL